METRKISGLFSIFGVILIASTTEALTPQSASAQFENCLNSGSVGDNSFGNSNRWRDQNIDVVIGREIYNAVAFMSPSRSGEVVSTCRLDPTPGSTYRYAVGFDDQDSNTYPAQIVVYLNGNEISRQTIRHGQLYSRFIDTAGARSISIEAVCTRTSGCNRLWFVQLGAENTRSSGSSGLAMLF